MKCFRSPLPEGVSGEERAGWTVNRRHAAVVLLCSASPLAGANGQQAGQLTPPSAADISEIRLERDCFGCPSGQVLLLRRDGSALLTHTGKARHRTEDRIEEGALSVSEFDQLAMQAMTQGFFVLDGSYEDADLRDGAWSQLRILHRCGEKTVFSREGAGPAALRALHARIEAVQAHIGLSAAPDRLRQGP